MNAHDKFNDLRKRLADTNLERYDEIEIALTAIVSGGHAVFIGPPGTAKSQLVRHICSAFDGANYFERLLTRFSTPEELFGPLNLRALEDGRYERVTGGYLPEAHIAFLDEVFKANSAILNALLSIINERLFHNGSATPIQVPLVSLFGASNELPESSELGAVFDRFQFRRIVNYMVEPTNFIKMLGQSGEPDLPSLSLNDLAEARLGAHGIHVSDSVKEMLYELRSQLAMEGIIVSDRRSRQGIGALQALAWLDGVDAVVDEQFRILQHMFWTTPQDIKRVSRIILSNTNPLDLEAEELIDQANEIAEQATTALQECKAKSVDPVTTLTKQGIEWYGKVKVLGKKVKDLEARAAKAGRPLNRIHQAKNRVLDVGYLIGKSVMGFDLVQQTQDIQ